MPRAATPEVRPVMPRAATHEVRAVMPRAAKRKVRPDLPTAGTPYYVQIFWAEFLAKDSAHKKGAGPAGFPTTFFEDVKKNEIIFNVSTKATSFHNNYHHVTMTI